MFMPKFLFDKLVRDNIVGLQVDAGYGVDCRAVVGAEMVSALLTKLHEEVEEVTVAVRLGDHSEVVKELADVQELLSELMVRLGVSVEDVDVARLVKNEHAGSFSQGMFVDAVDIPNGDSWVEYYRGQPVKYPEL